LNVDAMKALLTLGLLIVATGLEAGGDAVIRSGLRASSLQQRALLLAIGAAMLFGYGTFLTSAPVDFGKLLGIYVVVFFIMAQVINFVAFGTRPTLPIVVGGMLIVAGGAVISAWRT
jgi:drug/metabolite transporter superfamily protein YnfA